MKTTLVKFVTKFIPISLVTIVLVSTLTGFKAEMFTVGGGAGLRQEENVETAETGGSGGTTGVNGANGSPGNTTVPGANGVNGSNGLPGNTTVPGANGANGLPGTAGAGGLPVFGGSFINPLTGVSTASDISRNRPVAISVSNQRGALPSNATNGISQADIVYELLVEGGGTRMIALFQDFTNVGVVGSIRSARHYTVQLAEAYDAIFIHAGGSPLGYEEIENRNITNLDEVSGTRAQVFRRDVNRVPGHTVENYHSVTTSGASVSQWFPSLGIRLTHANDFRQALFFTDNPIPSGARAHNANIRFSAGKNSTFAYNEAQNLYYMSQYGSQFTDANNGNPVTFTNLLILEIPIKDLVGRGEGSGRQDMSTVGSGTGYFVSGGRYISINWIRVDKSSQFVYLDNNGNIIDLGRGKTYIGIVPPEMTQSFS